MTSIFGALWNRTILQSFNVLHACNMCLHLIKGKLSFLCFLTSSYFYYWSVTSYWNQMGVLQWEGVLTFTTVLAVLVNHKYQDSTTATLMLAASVLYEHVQAYLCKPNMTVKHKSIHDVPNVHKPHLLRFPCSLTERNGVYDCPAGSRGELFCSNFVQLPLLQDI